HRARTGAARGRGGTQASGSRDRGYAVTPDVVVDVGNTRMKWGLCSSGQIQEIIALPPDSPEDWEHALTKHAKGPGRHRWAISGVHPARIERFAGWLRG